MKPSMHQLDQAEVATAMALFQTILQFLESPLAFAYSKKNAIKHEKALPDGLTKSVETLEAAAQKAVPHNAARTNAQQKQHMIQEPETPAPRTPN